MELGPAVTTVISVMPEKEWKGHKSCHIFIGQRIFSQTVHCFPCQKTLVKYMSPVLKHI